MTTAERGRVYGAVAAALLLAGAVNTNITTSNIVASYSVDGDTHTDEIGIWRKRYAPSVCFEPVTLQLLLFYHRVEFSCRLPLAWSVLSSFLCVLAPFERGLVASPRGSSIACHRALCGGWLRTNSSSYSKSGPVCTLQRGK